MPSGRWSEPLQSVSCHRPVMISRHEVRQRMPHWAIMRMVAPLATMETGAPVTQFIPPHVRQRAAAASVRDVRKQALCRTSIARTLPPSSTTSLIRHAPPMRRMTIR